MAIKEAVDLIKRYEGCKLEAYLCPANVWTIGWGHTGTEVIKGLKITQEEADRLLEKDIERIESTIKPMIKVPVNENQIGALISFAYNLGPYALKKSTLLKMINEGKADEAGPQFNRWVYAAGTKLSGLVSRRELERQLFEKEVS